jgi:hypothetical protein
MDHPGTKLELQAAETLLGRCESFVADMKRDLTAMDDRITDLYHTIDARLRADQETDQAHLTALFELRQHFSRMRSLCDLLQSCASFGLYEQEKEYLEHIVVWISKEQYEPGDGDRSMIWVKNEQMVAKVRDRLGTEYLDLARHSNVIARVSRQVTRFLTEEVSSIDVLDTNLDMAN